MQKIKRKGYYIIMIMCLILGLSGCNGSRTRENAGPEPEDWGSFTAERTDSYDGKYYAVQETEENMGIDYVKVSIYETENDEFVFSFTPARASDFWGICWESDTYNIWIQSADIGVLCYKYDNMQWNLDESAERPEDIISKWD